MKLLSRMFQALPKRMAAAAIVALAIALPAIGIAAETVQIEGGMGVANVTAGDTSYNKSVNATYNQVVKYQVYYHNRENADSGKIAQNLNVKINLPSTAGKVQTASATIKADNSNTVTDSATVNLDSATSYLQYIPGTAVWRHNVGDNTNVNYVDTKISDDVVTQGLTLENEKPCYNFSATVTVQARVMVPGVQIIKQVRVDKTGATYATSNTANPDDTLLYRIIYTNNGNTTQNHVVLRDQLPNGLTIVPGTTVLTNATYPNGTLAKTDGIVTGGIDIGTYAPGVNAYIVFKAKVPAASALACGDTVYKNLGFAHPENMPEYYNSAITTVTKTCAPPQPTTPTYSCDLLQLTQGDNRTVTVKQFNHSQTNGALFKSVVIDWGDQTAALTTNTPVGKTHQFAKDGTYTVTATAHFTVTKEDVSATSGTCAQTVTFTSTPSTPAVQSDNTTTPTLVNTGPGQVIGMFAAVAVVTTIAHRLYLARRLTRQ